MKTIITLPTVLQSVGLACVPVPDMPPGEPALARRPVAAAVVSLQRRADGHAEVVAATLSDAHELELPLPWLVEQTLVPGAPTVVSAADRAVLAVDAAGRRYWAEPRLAALCGGAGAIEPGTLVAGSGLVADEAALCRRWQVPAPLAGDAAVERGWSRHAPEAAMDAALGHAVARLMLWAHARAFADGEPDAFFETLLPLRDWMFDREGEWPSLRQASRSRPIMRAGSFASDYRRYCDARDAGDTGAAWGVFEEGLFHT